MSSPFSGRIAFDATAYEADAPFTPQMGRAILAANLDHYADQAGQVRVCWRTDDSATRYLTTRTLTAADASVPCLIWESAPWAAIVDTDRLPYRYRVRIAGYASQATSITFRAIIGPPGAHAVHANGTGNHVLDATTSSTTDAWLSPADTLIDPIDHLEGARARIATIDDVGGDPVTVDVLLLSFAVYGITANTSTEPRVTGLYAAEYVGT